MGFEVLRAVATKITTFCDVTKHSLIETWTCFGGTYCLHL